MVEVIMRSPEASALTTPRHGGIPALGDLRNGAQTIPASSCFWLASSRSSVPSVVQALSRPDLSSANTCQPSANIFAQDALIRSAFPCLVMRPEAEAEGPCPPTHRAGCQRPSLLTASLPTYLTRSLQQRWVPRPPLQSSGEARRLVLHSAPLARHGMSCANGPSCVRGGAGGRCGRRQ